MPKAGKEVCLTELEVAVLHPFVERKILDDNTVISALKELIEKLEGTYANYD